jgi:hypothetical protein
MIGHRYADWLTTVEHVRIDCECGAVIYVCSCFGQSDGKPTHVKRERSCDSCRELSTEREAR